MTYCHGKRRTLLHCPSSTAYATCVVCRHVLDVLLEAQEEAEAPDLSAVEELDQSVFSESEQGSQADATAGG